MKGNNDIRELLASWPYDAASDVRIIVGEDGREVLQVRLPNGIEQYETEGRPDGLRPHDFESLLDYQRDLYLQAKRANQAAGFKLTPQVCAELFAEGTLYYYRYSRLFELRNWVRTIRDTRRNLGLFDFINRHAEREADQLYLEQWRPYVLRINATASAMQELEKGNFEEAHGILDTAIHTIENLPNLDVETFKEEKQRALKTLHSIVDQIKNVRPQSELERLEKELKKAVLAQEFELAAKLRDRIRGMREQTKPPPEATP